MASRGKSKQACSNGLSQRLKEDRISQLPDPLICKILSYLPTKEAVKTSVLSTRWRSLWLWVSRLELNFMEFSDVHAFVSFGDKFFDSSRESCLHKIKLKYCNDGGVDDNKITSWIDAAIKRMIQHLNVHCALRTSFHGMSPSLYVCETLVSLKLHNLNLANAEFVSLPCLKTMHLSAVRYPNEATFERLVSSCPVLEELEIQGCVNSDAKVFRVFSRSLNRLTIGILSLHDIGSGVVIDAHRLRLLIINVYLSESFIITNMDANVKLVLRFGFVAFDEAGISAQRNRFHSFLPGISKVRNMIICRHTFKLICEYMKIKLLPQFVYMTHLHVILLYSHSTWLPTFLESFPNLKSLILEFDYEERPSEEMNQISFSSVPECLISSLEYVDFKISIWGRVFEMKLVRYFLENSAILKKLTLPWKFSSARESILKEVLRMPRGSTKCEVVILD